jgi:hypothetical protein
MQITFLILFIILQIADVALTLKALELGKVEKNPFLRRAFEYFNPLKVMIAVKVVGTYLLFYLDIGFITAACCAVYVLVVLNNWKVVRS